MKNALIISLVILFGVLLQNCSDVDYEGVVRNQSGALIWGGSPAVDGVGMIFQTADTTYGLRGDRDAYARYFPDNENTVRVRANVLVTGETTIRGWGTRFPEAVLSKIRPE
jgi:hypothetical protein